LIHSERHLLATLDEYVVHYDEPTHQAPTTTPTSRQHCPTADHRPRRRTPPTTNDPQWTHQRILPGSIGRTRFTGGRGSIGYADPARDYAFAYVTRRLADFDRVDTVADAVISAIEP
jgi:hypothetical protein